MCGTSASADRLLVVHEARVAADGARRALPPAPRGQGREPRHPRRVRSRRGAPRRQLRRATGRADVDAVREAIAVLDVDWARTTAAERRRLVSEAMAAAGRCHGDRACAHRGSVQRRRAGVVAATRTDARRSQRLAIGAEFNAVDRRVVAHVTSSQGNFVRDEYGRRIPRGSAGTLRRIVAAGLEGRNQA